MHIRDRVAQTTNSAGTGNVELNGTLAGFKTFAGALPAIPAASDKPFPVLVKDGDAWELFESYLISGTPDSLFRGAILSSSAIDGSRITLSSAENKPVYLLEPAEGYGPMGGRASFAVTTGTAPDYIAAFATPIRALKTGTRCTVLFHAVNPTAENTFAADGLTTKPLKWGRPLRKIAAGRILANLLAGLEFNEAADAWIVAWGLPIGGIVKEISATTYTVLEEDHEVDLVFTHANGCSVGLPQGTGQFAAPFRFNARAAGGTLQFTPTTSTIAGGSRLAVAGGRTVEISARGGNYDADHGLGTVPAGQQGEDQDIVYKNDATTPNSKIAISATAARLFDSNGNVAIARGLSLTADIAVSGLMGLSTGSEANNTWYYTWLIAKAAMWNAVQVTADATSNKITLNGHGLAANTPVKFGGTAPGGLTAGVTYYVNSPGANDFGVSAAPGGSAIDLTTAGSGVTLTELAAAIVDPSATSPTLPSGYTFSKRGAAFRNDGSSNLKKLYQEVTRFTTLTPHERVVNAAAPAAADTYQSLSLSAVVPPTARIVVCMVGSANTGTGSATFVAANSSGGGRLGNHADGGGANSEDYGHGAMAMIAMETAQTIYWKKMNTTADGLIDIVGYWE